jgi:hypothetical protein
MHGNPSLCRRSDGQTLHEDGRFDRGVSLMMAQRLAFAALLCLAALSLAPLASGAPPRRATKPAYFEVDYPPSRDRIVIRIHDRALIAQARRLAGRRRPRLHVGGIIVKEPAPYNTPWHFHLDPDSITFFELSAEVYDSSIRGIEEHLDEVGGELLPGNQWLPWGSRILREVRSR